MRFLSTFHYGFADYGVGIVLLLLPYTFGFADGTAAQFVPQVLGVAAVAYSLFTAYELRWKHVIPMRVHLWLDGLSGVLLLASPWLFGFAERVVWPHVLFGLVEITASLITKTQPTITADDRAAAQR